MTSSKAKSVDLLCTSTYTTASTLFPVHSRSYKIARHGVKLSFESRQIHYFHQRAAKQRCRCSNRIVNLYLQKCFQVYTMLHYLMPVQLCPVVPSWPLSLFLSLPLLSLPICDLSRSSNPSQSLHSSPFPMYNVSPHTAPLHSPPGCCTAASLDLDSQLRL